ncbi:Uncharacterised protein [Vibrio cholerae]|nr:Uncharacterised protein [Vibrio cholerae]
MALTTNWPRESACKPTDSKLSLSVLPVRPLAYNKQSARIFLPDFRWTITPSLVPSTLS